MSHGSNTAITTASGSGERRTHKIHNPYSSLSSEDILPLHQLIYDIPTSPEYLFHEESTSRHRSWGHNLSFCTGLGYLGGSIAGGLKGSINGARSAEKGESWKLRTNRVLNSGGSQGGKLGNVAGVMGLMFSVMESGVMHLTGDEGWLSSVTAAVGTGACYRAAKGVRSAAIAGVVGGLAAGVAVAGKNAVKRYVPI